MYEIAIGLGAVLGVILVLTCLTAKAKCKQWIREEVAATLRERGQ
jgi:hypothetical protein